MSSLYGPPLPPSPAVSDPPVPPAQVFPPTCGVLSGSFLPCLGFEALVFGVEIPPVLLKLSPAFSLVSVRNDPARVAAADSAVERVRLAVGGCRVAPRLVGISGHAFECACLVDGRKRHQK